VDSAIRVFSKNGRKLRVVGDGPEYKALKRGAAGNVEFCGRLNDEEVRELYARCRALLMTAEEDFGITAVEALASGNPVIALGRGGALETVPIADPVGGQFFDESTDDSLEDAIQRWDQRETEVEPRTLQAHAAKFSEAEFVRKIQPLLTPLRHVGKM
jgi:glycosyltransferase involved in cell wall biosynthesis